MMTRHDSVTRWLVGSFALLMLVTAGAHAGEKSQPPSTGMVGEQRVFYTDMLQAYAAGSLDEARALARAHLQRLGRRLEDPRLMELESAVHGILGVTRSMLQAENKLAPAGRLAASGMIGEIDAVLRRAKTTRKALVDSDPRLLRYLDGELGIVAADWIRAKRPLVPAGELAATYDAFRTDLARQGYTTVEAVLQGPEIPAAVERFTRFSAREEDQISQAVRDYFQGLIDGSAARLSSATGCDPDSCARLLQAFEADCQEEGVKLIHEVAVPAMDGLRLQIAGPGQDLFTTMISGIELDVTLNDETRKTMTIRKHLRLRPDPDGRWFIEPPEK